MSGHIRRRSLALGARAAVGLIVAVGVGAGAVPALASATPGVRPDVLTTAAALPSQCSQSGLTVTCKYTAQGESQFSVPQNVSSVQATTIGAQGGEDFVGDDDGDSGQWPPAPCR